jgi:hypothetical protein
MPCVVVEAMKIREWEDRKEGMEHCESPLSLRRIMVEENWA